MISAAGLAKGFAQYGPFIHVRIMGQTFFCTDDPILIEIITKESKYFTKKNLNSLKQVKDFAGNGLFTTDTDQDEWKLAHKLLMPAFSARAIKVYKKIFIP
jgi:cytochrome P450/NADPH-cytochrome P450 reductase